jgi:ankyrin repeat protein
MLPFGPVLGIEMEWLLYEMPLYASTIRPAIESSLKEIRSVFGLTILGAGGPSSADDYLLGSLLCKLEIDVPEFPVERFKQDWEMLPLSSHTDTVLQFLEYVVYLSSNNMLDHNQMSAVYQWLLSGKNRPVLDALVSSGLPTAQALLQRIFTRSITEGQLHVARALRDAKIGISELLQFPRQILQDAVSLDAVEPVRFLLEGGVDVSLCTPILYKAKSVEVASLLLQAGVDINEPSKWNHFRSTALGNAVYRGNFNLAKFLIEKGADVNLTNELRGARTPLRAALESRNVRLIELLLDNGAEVDAPNYAWGLCLDIGLYSGNHWATPLQVAAAHGDVELARPLLLSGADVNAPSFEMSALHWGVKSGSTEMIRLLLAHRANPNAPANNQYKSTAIQIAAERGDKDTIQILLAAGATISSSADLCLLRAQLCQAIRDGNIDRARAILQLGVDVNKSFSDRKTPISEAILSGDAEMVRLLVEAGADVNMPCRSHSSPEFTVTPLQFMLELMGKEREKYKVYDEPQAQVAKMLLDAGANPNPPRHPYWKHTLLYSAVSFRYVGEYSLARLLLAAGASIDTSVLKGVVEDWNRSKDFNFLHLLIDYGADVNATDHGDSVLQASVYASDTDLVRFLLKNNADVNVPAAKYWGRTALQAATELVGRKPISQTRGPSGRQLFEMVELLIEEGANVNAPPASHFGRTALQAATGGERGSIRLIQLLLDAGADVNAPASAWWGFTALQGAAIRGHIKFALMLLEEGADVNAPGSRVNGRTALEEAAEHGRLDMVQLLINAGADSHLPGRQRYKSAATFAAKEGHFAVSNLLKAHFEE